MEPFANLAYVSLHTKRFTEQDGVAALTARGQSSGTTFATLGVRGSARLGGGFRAAATLGWRHALDDVMPRSTLASRPAGMRSR